MAVPPTHGLILALPSYYFIHLIKQEAACELPPCYNA